MIIDAYVRVSTEEQARDGVSLDTQIGKIQSYHALYGGREGCTFDIGETIIDAGASAKTLDRPGLRIALDRMKTRKSDGLIIAKLDRLTRSLKDWSQLMDDYFGEKPGRKLIAVENEVNTLTANGRMMLNMIVLIAQWERETISERTRDNLRTKINAGERCGKVLFGYQLDQAGPRNKRGLPVRLVPHPEEQATIYLMQKLKAEGLSLREVGARLVAIGITPREGAAAWTASTIAKILKRTA